METHKTPIDREEFDKECGVGNVQLIVNTYHFDLMVCAQGFLLHLKNYSPMSQTT